MKENLKRMLSVLMVFVMVCGMVIPASATEQSTEVYTGTGWPHNVYYLKTVTVTGVEVTGQSWEGDTNHVTLSCNTPMDAAVTVTIAISRELVNKFKYTVNGVSGKTATVNLVDGQTSVPVYLYAVGPSYQGTKTFELTVDHSYENGVCTVCNAKDPSLLFGGETITAGGTYYLDSAATGAITVATTAPITVVGNGAEWNSDTTSAEHGTVYSTANSDLSIVGSVAGINLTLKDMFLNNSGVAAVDVTGIGNTLTFDGTVIIDQNNAPNVHVGPDAGITIKGTTGSRAYLYKTSQTAGIGGNSGEACGTVVFGEENGANDFYMFMKGSRQGAVIGNGANCSAVPGNITFHSGIYNLLGIARGAIISGSAGADSQGAGNVIVNGGLINMNVDFSGAAIGGGGYAEGNDKAGGSLYVSGGSIRTYIDSNATSSWGVEAAGVNDKAITAGRVNGDGSEDVYLLTLDTTDITADSYTITVDGETFYVGSRYSYSYYLEDANRDIDGDGSPDVATTPKGTPGNWVALDESCFYLYVTGEDHTVSVNGVETKYTWDAESKTFAVAESGNGWYEAGNETGTYEIGTAEELAQFAAIVNGTDETYAKDNFSGKTVNLTADIALAEDGLYTATENITYGSGSYAVTATQYIVSAEAPIWTPIGSASASTNDVTSTANAFAGTFDGKGFTVSGLYTDVTKSVQGLFGVVSGTVKNVTVSGCVAGYTVVGGVAGYLYNGTIENCVNNAAVFATAGNSVGRETGINRGGAVGGIVGRAAGTSAVTDNTNNAEVICVNTYKGGRVGGIIGLIDATDDVITITRNANNGDVTGYQYVAGILGMNYSNKSPITSCFNTGHITGWGPDKTHVGGIVGQYTSAIENCWSSGNVSLPNTSLYSAYAGMIAGDFNYSFSDPGITNCYVTGDMDPVGAYKTGLIVGEGKSSNCYYLDTAKVAKGDSETGTIVSKTAQELASVDMIALLGEGYQATCGYPILTWQTPKAHTFEDGSCTDCGAADPNVVTYAWYESGNVTGTYEIGTAEELAQFAAIVNGTDENYGKDTFKGKTVKLTADIDLSAVCSAELGTWNSIGGAAENVVLTINSQEELNAALYEYNILYDDTGWSYKYGTDKNLGYSSARTYYAVVGQIFSGTFDGNGKTIDNLYVKATAGYAGLFGNVDGTLKNFTVKGTVTVATGTIEVDFAGGVTGKLSEGGRIEGVTSYVDVDASAKCYNVGGIAGFNGTKNATADNKFTSANNTVIINCVNYGKIYGWSQVGGITGENAGQIIACANYGDVDAKKDGSKAGIGGIAGRNGCNNTAYTSGTIESCFNFGTIADDQNKWVGGIAGFNNAASSIKNCYNVGEVYGAGQANAICGQNEAAGEYIISNCWYLESTKVFDESGVYGGKYENCGSMTEDEMKDPVFAAILGENYNVDDGQNNGYPVLKWMGGTQAPALYTVILPDSNETFVISTSDSTTVAEGGSFAFKIFVEDGYTIDFVKANDVELTAVNGVYTVEDINSDVTISISVSQKAIEPEVVYGDIGGDGEITNNDAALVYAYCNSTTELTDAQIAAADVNGDGEVTNADAALIYAFANGKLDAFPVK